MHKAMHTLEIGRKHGSHLFTLILIINKLNNHYNITLYYDIRDCNLLIILSNI